MAKRVGGTSHLRQEVGYALPLVAFKPTHEQLPHYFITNLGTTVGTQPEVSVTLKEGWLRVSFPNRQSHPEKCQRALWLHPVPGQGRSCTVLHKRFSSPFSKEFSQHSEIACVDFSLPWVMICNKLSCVR